MHNKNKGITLVALVITIIILLILAGVAISALTQTGLFDNAKQAKNATENAQNKEEGILNEYEKEIAGYGNGEENKRIANRKRTETKGSGASRAYRGEHAFAIRGGKSQSEL